MELHGARYLHILVTCPLGWACAASDSIRVARLAKETGLFPVIEAEHGEVTGVSKIRRRQPGRGVPRTPGPLPPPVQARAQRGRARPDPGARGPQHREVRAACDGEALRNNPRGRLEPCEQDGRLARPSARSMCDRLAAVQPRLPGRGEHPGLAVRGRGRGLRAGVAHDHARQPVPRRRSGRVCYHPCRPPATARRSTRRSASTPSSGSSATRRIEQGWKPDAAAPATASAC